MLKLGLELAAAHLEHTCTWSKALLKWMPCPAQMELGDCIYLAMERRQLKYGFMLQPALGEGQETDRQVTKVPCCHSLACHCVTRTSGLNWPSVHGCGHRPTWQGSICNQCSVRAQPSILQDMAWCKQCSCNSSRRGWIHQAAVTTRLEGKRCLQAKRARVDAPSSGAQQSPKYAAQLPHGHDQPAGGNQAGMQVAHQGYPPAGQHQQAGGYQPGMPSAHQGYQPAACAHYQPAEEHQSVRQGVEQGYQPAGEHPQELDGHAQQQGHLPYQQDAGGSQQQQGQEAGQAQEALVQDSAQEPGPTQESGDALHMALCMARLSHCCNTCLAYHRCSVLSYGAACGVHSCPCMARSCAQQGAAQEGSMLNTCSCLRSLSISACSTIAT